MTTDKLMKWTLISFSVSFSTSQEPSGVIKRFCDLKIMSWRLPFVLLDRGCIKAETHSSDTVTSFVLLTKAVSE